MHDILLKEEVIVGQNKPHTKISALSYLDLVFFIAAINNYSRKNGITLSISLVRSLKFCELKTHKNKKYREFKVFSP